ncbi:hypothetical protein GCM10020331_023280 [Ectobacillus funiculus]
MTLISGGTDNHLILVDVRNLDITGKVAEHVLDEVGITVNKKNAIPFDPASPFVTSGIRLGTAAATSRGFGLEEMDEIASVIAYTLKKNHDNEQALEEARKRVNALTAKIPNVSRIVILYISYSRHLVSIRKVSFFASLSINF